MPANGVKRIKSENVYLHVFNSGVEKLAIFKERQDYETFREFLREYFSAPLDKDSRRTEFEVRGRTYKGIPHQRANYFSQVELVGYTLLPDHFHLIVHQRAHGAVQKFMRSLGTRYSIYFNKKYKHKGRIFSGVYKSVQIDDIGSLPSLSAYFYKEYQSRFPDIEDGVATSYPEYIGRRQSKWIMQERGVEPRLKSTNYKKYFEEFIAGKEGEDLQKYLILHKENYELVKIDPVLERRKPQSQAQNHNHNSLFMSGSAFLFSFLFVFSVMKVRAYSDYVLPSEIPKTSAANVSIEPQVSGASDFQQELHGPKLVERQVVIAIEDNSGFVNLRTEPSIYSEKAGEALHGEIYEYVSDSGEWHEIKYKEGRVFVSKKYSRVFREQ